MQQVELNLDRALNTPGFMAFLAGYSDKGVIDVTDAADQKKIADRFRAFQALNRATDLLKRVIREEIIRDTDVVLDPADLKSVDAFLDREVTTNPEFVVDLLDHAERLAGLPAELREVRDEYAKEGGTEAYQQATLKEQSYRDCLDKHCKSLLYKLSRWPAIGALFSGTRRNTECLWEAHEEAVEQRNKLAKLRGRIVELRTERNKIRQRLFAIHQIVDPIVKKVQVAVVEKIERFTEAQSGEPLQKLERALDYLDRLHGAGTDVAVDWLERVGDAMQFRMDLQEWIRQRQYADLRKEMHRIPKGQVMLCRVKSVLVREFLARRRSCGRSEDSAREIIVDALRRLCNDASIRDEHKMLLRPHANPESLAQLLQS